MTFDASAPFLRRTGIAAGVTPQQLRGPGYRCVLPGAYVAPPGGATTAAPARRRGGGDQR